MYYYGFIPLPLLAILMLTTQYYKRFLIACEYLQIDPSHSYPIDYVRDRVNYALSCWSGNEAEYRKFRKNVVWLRRNYRACAGIWYGFVKKSKKLTNKGHLVVHFLTVSGEYSKQPLTQTNYDFYAKNQNKFTIIALAIMIPVFAAFFIIMALG